MTRNPDFIIIGAMKGGTTALSQMLASHSGIHVARVAHGEVHFFDNKRNKGVGWYRSLFKGPKKCGEKSPRYMAVPEAMTYMSMVCPDVKLIVTLRDPVERFLSHLTMMKRGRKREPGLTAKIDARWRGCYAPQLQHILGLFPKENVHIIFNEELRSHTLEVVNGVFRFIDVAEVQKLNLVSSERKKGPWPHVRQTLSEYYHPHNQQLLDMFPEHEQHIRKWKGMS